jgi:hypothetical protein
MEGPRQGAWGRKEKLIADSLQLKIEKAYPNQSVLHSI